MSQVRDNFLAAARTRNWKTAYLNCNGLNMFEMLRGLQEVGPALLSEMRLQISAFVGLVDTPRIQYAMDVVQLGRLPAVAPGDLAATGQVQEARNFLTPAGTSETEKLVQALIQYLDRGRLNATTNRVDLQIRALAHGGKFRDAGGHQLTASIELLRTLVGLVDDNPITLLSMFRFADGPHGEPQPDGTAIGRAVDISAYAGSVIHLKDHSNAPRAIDGVSAVIQNLPLGRYTLGLPRPGGGPLIDPPNDVFLPVTDHSQVDRSPTGTFATDILRVIRPAREAIQGASRRNPGAQIQFLFPDAVDHLHVKAVR